MFKLWLLRLLHTLHHIHLIATFRKCLRTLAQKPVFFLGFRIFFLSTALMGFFAMLWWYLEYQHHLGLPVGKLLVAQYWHGHEMIYGMASAVVAGFLLTAVQNWTGVPMPHGKALCRIWLSWFLARSIFWFAPTFALLGAALDMLFSVQLAKTVIHACRQAEGQSKRQAGIIAKLVLLSTGNILFFLGLLFSPILMRQSLYFGVFVIIGLVLTIGRRVMPFFTKNAMPQPFEPRNSDSLDQWALRSFLLFFFCWVFIPTILEPFWSGLRQSALFAIISALGSLAALITAALNAYRLQGWWHRDILRFPLLWSMYLAIGFVLVGFVLYGLLPLGWGNESLALHAMAIGGLGLMVYSMIGRVSLGHTGRSVHQPPKALCIGLYLMGACFVARVLLPLMLPSHYLHWIALAQALWLAAFGLQIIAYWTIWNQPRIDGKAG
ncbi:MAG: NnrS family protein [Cardiobacteriaceae bacterium]|nr:NnrS family protein [Cardiobacteriaceae bacterium]